MKNLIVHKYIRGTTFIEVLLYIALLSVVIIFITDIILQTLSFMIEARNISYLDSDARFINTKIRNDIRRADTILSPQTVGQTTSSVGFVYDGANYSYSLNNGALEITDPNGTYRINSDQTTVSGFSVQNASYTTGSPTLNFSIILQSRTVSSSISQININFTVNTRQ